MKQNKFPQILQPGFFLKMKKKTERSSIERGFEVKVEEIVEIFKRGLRNMRKEQNPERQWRMERDWWRKRKMWGLV